MRTFILHLVLLSSLALNAQSAQLKNQTLSATGSSSILETSSGSLMVQQSIGQSSSIGKGQGSTINARQGFIQPSFSALNTTQNSTLQAKVYPNPFSSGFNIEFEQDLSANVSILILDVTGRTVYSKEFVHLDSRTIKLKELHFQAGSYFLKVSSSYNTFSSTLIKS